MEAGHKKSVLVIDDHALFRAGLILLLEKGGYKAKYTEAGDYKSALECCQNGAFDVILLDLLLPDRDSPVVIDEFSRFSGAAKIVVVSMIDKPDAIVAALDQGAAGFILKSSQPEVMLQAISLVESGGIYIPAVILDSRRPLPANQSSGLTEAQSRVLRALAVGMSNKEIAAELGITESTVKIHMAALMRLLGVKNRTQVVLAAKKEILIP